MYEVMLISPQSMLLMCGTTVHERPVVSTLQAQAWAAAERSLASRLREAEANAAAAAAREAAAEEALGALQVRGGCRPHVLPCNGSMGARTVSPYPLVWCGVVPV